MTLAFNNLSGIQLGHWVDITGTIKNTIANSVSPTPEPTAILLMGVGLFGVAIIGRKQLITKK